MPTSRNSKARSALLPMSPATLGKLARRLAKSKSCAESAKLKTRITEGFCAGS